METGDVEADDGGDVEVSCTDLSGSHRIPLRLGGRENGVQSPNCKSQGQSLVRWMPLGCQQLAGWLVKQAVSESQGYVTRSPVTAF